MNTSADRNAPPGPDRRAEHEQPEREPDDPEADAGGAERRHDAGDGPPLHAVEDGPDVGVTVAAHGRASLPGVDRRGDVAPHVVDHRPDLFVGHGPAVGRHPLLAAGGPGLAVADLVVDPSFGVPDERRLTGDAGRDRRWEPPFLHDRAQIGAAAMTDVAVDVVQLAAARDGRGGGRHRRCDGGVSGVSPGVHPRRDRARVRDDALRGRTHHLLERLHGLAVRHVDVPGQTDRDDRAGEADHDGGDLGASRALQGLKHSAPRRSWRRQR
jgi:hypothetical protein